MLVALALTTILSPASLEPTQLRCEALTDPVGIGTAEPRLSWKLRATAPELRNLRQRGYRLRVASSASKLDSPDLWDTGDVASSDSVGITYAGKPLSSGSVCYWSVQVVDQDGNRSGWSPAAKWSEGLLSPLDWKAQWIGYDAPLSIEREKDAFRNSLWIWSDNSNENATVFFQARVNAAPGWTKATIRMTADDQFSLSVNGKTAAASDGQTDAWHRPVTADVSALIVPGDNVLAVKATNEKGGAGLIGHLTLTYPDGHTVEIDTGSAWQVSESAAGPWRPCRVVSAYGGDPWGKFGDQIITPAPRFLRHGFSLSKPVRRATLYGSALGLMELQLNGRAVSDELFMPGWTDYTKRVYARAYDVTKSLKSGSNALGVILGDGWYSGYVGFGGRRDHYGTKTRALVQLNVEYADGTTETVASSPEWKASTGPLAFSDFLMGERYDARAEVPAWSTSGFADQTWKPVDTGAEMNPAVEPFPGQPVRAYDELHAKKITEPKKDSYVMDLGQNMAGFARLRVRGKKGQKITLRFAERLSPDGTIYTTNLRGARATDEYICRGEGVEVWQPRFTFHGFQYVEVTGLGHRPGRNEVVGIAISSDTPQAGTLVTGDPMINKLVSNAWWTQRMNFIDIPTDCPQRDERLGWTGDAQAYVRTATMLTDVQPFFTKWLVALDDGQRADGQFPMVAPVKVAGDDGGPAWDAAGVICPWTIYDVYGDTRLLAAHYPQMRKFVDFYVKRSTPDLLPPKQFHCFGDWLNINADTPTQVIYEAYFAGCARLVSQAAAKLGNTADARKYEQLYQDVRRAFQKEYVAVDGVVAGNTQCAYVLALGFDLLTPEQTKMASERLVADIEKRGWHLSTGFVGTRDIMHVLSKIGRDDVAFRLLHNTTFPSWGFTIANGATSIWERWDGWTPDKGFQDAGMNSFAHYAFGAVVGWMMAQPAGITNPEPGFRVVRVAPKIDAKLKWLKSSYESVRGTVVSEWRLNGGRLTMHVVVPPNVRAEIVVPAQNVESDVPGRVVGGSTTYRVGSGEYTFVAPWSPSVH